MRRESNGPVVAPIAHDRKKALIIAVLAELVDALRHCRLCATRTMGSLIIAELGLDVERLLSGPLGGDLQIEARLAAGQVDLVIFLRVR